MTFTPWVEFLTRWNDGLVTPEELVAWQTSSLQEVLNHVEEKSPFYARHLAGIDLAVDSLEDLASIPFTTKQDLRDAMHDMLCGTVAEAAYYFETTGTTGRPTPCPRASIDFELNWLPLAHALDRIVHKHFDDNDARPVLAVIAPNDVHSACLSLSFAAKHIGITKLDLFPISPTLGFARFFEVLAELKVTILYCSPGLLMALAEMSAAYGVVVPDDLAVEVLLTTGEMCSDGMRDLLAETWQAEVYNFNYGSQEAGAPSVAHTDGFQMVVEPTYLLEVLDMATEETMGFEGYGELCLTSLVPGLKPLIRYRTGDLVRIQKNESGLREMEVLGRVRDMTDLGGTKRSAAEIDNAVLVDPTSIYGYEIDVHDFAGEDSLVVRVKSKEGADQTVLKQRVAESVRDLMRVPVRVEAHPLLNLKSTTGGWVSWKTARIRDFRSQEIDDIEKRSADALALAVERAI